MGSIILGQSFTPNPKENRESEDSYHCANLPTWGMGFVP